MSDSDDNFGGTKLVDQNGEQMDPAIAGISSPRLPTMEGDAGGAAIAAEKEDDTAGEAEMEALEEEEDGEADLT